MDEITQEEFGKILKNFRKEKGLTQRELADKIHVAQNTVSKWEDGMLNPGFLNIYNLCRAFNITLDEFLGIEETEYVTLTVRKNDIERLQITFQKIEKALAFIFSRKEDTKLRQEWAEHKRLLELLILKAE